MEEIIKSVKVNYELYGNGDKTIVLLHGWGQNIEMMKPIGDNFSKNYKVLIPDLPGFGKSDEPKDIWTMYDYADFIHELIEKLDIKKPILMGHSFGGKISLIYSSKYEVEKLVLFASPFRKGIKKLSLKTRMLKFLKKVPGLNKLEGYAKKHIGSQDYRQASEFMRKILVEHVNLDTTEDVKKIKCPTLLIWGTNDIQVPLDEAYVLEKLIKDSGLVVYEGCTHYAYLERLGQIINVLRSFLGGE